MENNDGSKVLSLFIKSGEGSHLYYEINVTASGYN